MVKILSVMERYRIICDDIWMDVFKKTGIPSNRARVLLNLSSDTVQDIGLNRFW
jgi:hypothetical protein